MYECELSPLRSSLCAIAVGMGKTVVAYLLVLVRYLDVKRQLAADPTLQIRCMPTLILTPPHLAIQFFMEAAMFFGPVIRAWLCYGSIKQVGINPELKEHMLDQRQFKQKCEGFVNDPYNPEASLL